MRKCLAIAALLLCAGVAGAVQFIRMIPLYGGAPMGTFTFGLQTNTAGTAPWIIAPTLTNYGDVVWYNPMGESTNSKTPAASFFRAAGQYSITCTDWSKVTQYRFNQDAARAFLTNVSHSALSSVMMLTNMAYAFYNSTNEIVYDLGLLPTGITSITYCWGENRSRSFPEVNHITGLRGAAPLQYAWVGCRNCQVFPEVNGLTNVTSVAATWRYCTSLTNPPAISNMPLADVGGAWYYNSALTNGFLLSRFDSFTNLSSIGNAWGECAVEYGLPDISNNTKIAALNDAWMGCANYTGVFPSVSYGFLYTNITGTELRRTWNSCSAQKNAFPEVSNLVQITQLNQTWSSAEAFTGKFPNVSALVSNTYLGSTWARAYKATEFPDVSAHTNVTDMNFAWAYAYACTNFPDVHALTNNRTFDSTWYLCTNARTMPITNSSCFPLATNYNDCFAECRVMEGSFASWVWRTNIFIYDSWRSRIRYTNVPACLATNVCRGFEMRVDSSTLPADHVAQILIDLDTSGASNGVLNVGGASGTGYTSNAAPTAAGYVAVTNLRAKGWTVTVN